MGKVGNCMLSNGIARISARGGDSCFYCQMAMNKSGAEGAARQTN